MRVLIIGCGYVGMPLGERLVRSGHEVFGMRRSSGSDQELQDLGIVPLHADVTQPDQLAAISPNFDFVVNLASSTRGGVDEYKAVYFVGTQNILDWLRANPPRRYIYTSSTSVYAQTDGSVVTEQSPAEPESETSRILRETEDLLLAQNTVPSIILRVSGIYGPERGHLFKQYLRGEAVMRDDGSHFINMIHVNDVAGAIERCLVSGTPGEIYNLTDDEAVTQLEFFQWLSHRLRKPMPPKVPADPRRKRGVTNKRVSNAKLKLDTCYTFQFPTFREGYSAEMHRLGFPV
jgi:nucleoside-diphosphate-sugar epimerase